MHGWVAIDAWSDKALEAEGRADIDGLAVAAFVGERFEAVALDLVADAAGHIEVAGDRIGAADVERIAFLGRQDARRVVALGADHDPAGDILAGVADADFRRLAAAREHAAIDLGAIAGDGEELPAHGNAAFIGGGRDRRDGARRRSGDGARRLGRGRGPGAPESGRATG